MLSRRRFCLGAGAALATGAVTLACSSPLSGSSPAPAGSTGSVGAIGPIALPTATASPTTGRWLIVRDGNFEVFDLATLQAQPLTHFPKGAYAASPAVSFDRKRIAYTYYVVPKDAKDLGGSDLYVADASGANPRLVRSHGEPGATFEDPAWSADGGSILATRRKPLYDANGLYQGEALAIYRVPLDGAEPTLLLKDALGPAASPDGKYLVYTPVDPKGQPSGLWIGDANGKGGTELLANQGFVYLRSPRFAPDGSRLAFAAVGGPGATPSGTRSGWLPPGFGVAAAHGIPWDIWTVRPDGSELKRLTYESEDTPIPAWSPNGEWIAFAGEIGLYLVDAAGQKTLRLSTTISGGGIAWLS